MNPNFSDGLSGVPACAWRPAFAGTHLCTILFIPEKQSYQTLIWDNCGYLGDAGWDNMALLVDQAADDRMDCTSAPQYWKRKDYTTPHKKLDCALKPAGYVANPSEILICQYNIEHSPRPP
jgi:hypothetical protein